MSQMSSLGAPISADLNFNPSGAGNPYAGILSGPAGLAQQYGVSYNNALQANQQNYNSIIGGYNTVMQNVGNTLGQGGGWGVAAPAAQAIADTYAQQSGGAMQNSINSGVGNTSAATAAQRGAALDANKAYAGLGSQLASTYAGYEANIGQNQLNFMNGVQIPYPDGSQYNNLYQQYGATQQAQASMAQQMALSQQQMRMAAGRGGSSGGGASVGAAPRGGTYGSGGGGFASGGGVAPTNTAGPSTTQNGNSSKGNSGAVGLGGQSINPSINEDGSLNGPVAYNPWSTNVDNPYGGLGQEDPASVTGNFGNTGYYLGSGVA